ncbi:uncharacterized protein MYCFIDRAFT_77835 [Pseudocercospora fijiensis CIRAD86]|uniref:Uncharacterized protein n=1 Tax=Pseudocercospora fijiensis (strain CIRAD86) TaxID=383855 RepID=M2YQN6_PSEFD|nr:uncharacterized protein MYCFIDRAFT_77835 [Pseudocercospora fijiensis CIRAD86]EME80045.1 hypothetical protein MYCFIDRAFT_77835 [Pseudocercospora fijiensis CIRAD86]
MADPGAEHLSSIKLELPLQVLQVEGGNVPIYLSASEVLLVDGKTLSAASPGRFKLRLGDRWKHLGGKEVNHPLTREKMSVYSYRLCWIDEAWTITDEDKSAWELREDAVVAHKLLLSLLYSQPMHELLQRVPYAQLGCVLIPKQCRGVSRRYGRSSSALLLEADLLAFLVRAC